MGKTNLFRLALALAALFVRCLVLSLATSKTNLTDESALLAFKSKIASDPLGIIASNWTTAAPFCDWVGVICAAHHRRVVALNLSYMHLEGNLPPQLGNLSFVASLDLRNNSFYGDLPTELGHLRRLKYMNFRNNNFNGSIPSSFRMLLKLEKLNLLNNHFTGTIPSTLSNLTMLQSLVLDDNLLQGSIPLEIGKLSNLQEIWVDRNQLSGSVPHFLFNISSLRILTLQSNHFSGGLQEDLCNHHSKLEMLSLSTNQLDGQIPSNLSMCKNLQSLQLDENEFTGSIPEEIGNLRSLETIYLGANYISGSIPPTLFSLSMLRLIGLDTNYLSGRLPSTLGLSLANLEYLYLGGNQLSGPIPNSIGNASQLVLLDFGGNSFSGLIPDSLGNLRNLRWLSLEANLLTSNPDPESNFLTLLTGCKQLEKLSLALNSLNISLPISIGNLSYLTSFRIWGSKIIGKIPPQIGNLSNLIELKMEQNELIGTIPTSIGRLQHLQYLSLFRNRIHGFIPQELCHIGNLAYLYLAENVLSGSIPSCIGNLTFLNELTLASNKFTFQIPPSLSNLNRILLLNLSSNSLEGSLPLDIGNFKVVRILDLSRNQLSGSIPMSIEGLTSLTDLNLSENRLQGNIPQSFGYLVSLVSLDLSRNSLSGPIPKSLEKLLYLRFLNLSFNRLQGEIPNGGPFKNFSATSFSGNEALCGSSKMQVPRCKDSTTAPSSRAHIIFVLKYVLPVLGSVALLLASVLLFTRYRKRKKIKFSKPQGDAIDLASWRRISYYELHSATGGFQESNLLGRGSFGSVYKGTLVDGMNVAIKVFNLQLEEAFKSFDVECDVLRNLRHRNLVKVISSCVSPEFKALVLEFMQNWSLEKWLYSQNYFMDVLQRLNIMIDVASALEYLHHDYTTPVVHCDLKPSNILLDEDMVAHVSDFGITKLLGDDSITRTITLATVGYMAPEYGSEGLVSVRGDVYSYGILLMETFTRKKPTDEMFRGDMSLKIWIKQSLPDAIIQIADANLLVGDEADHFEAKEYCVRSILELALECAADSPEQRLNIKDVFATLSKIKKKFLKDMHI